MFSLSNLITILAAASPLFVSGAHQEPAPHRRHHEVANRARGDIQRRFSGMRATYYAVGKSNFADQLVECASYIYISLMSIDM